MVKPDQLQNFIIKKLKSTKYSQMINCEKIDIDYIRGLVDKGISHHPHLEYPHSEQI